MPRLTKSIAAVGCIVLAVAVFRLTEHNLRSRFRSDLSSLDACQNPMADDDLSINGIARFATERKLKSVDDLLPCLPASMRAFYMLIYESHSPQKATPDRPRALMIDAKPVDGWPGRPRMKLAATFGSFSPHGFAESFEMAESNLADNSGLSLRFARLDFSASPPALKAHECAECHGHSPRPIIDSYPLWKGFYGSHEFACSQQELSLFSRFQKLSPGTRYASLENLDSFWGYFDSDRKRCLAQHNQAVHDAMIYEISASIASRVRATPQYLSLKFALLAGALGCPNILEFIPGRWRASFGKRRFLLPPFAQDQEEPALSLVQAAVKKLGGHPDFSAIKQDLLHKADDRRFFYDTIVRADQEAGLVLAPISNLRYLIEGRGYSMRDWFPDRDLATYRYSSGEQTGFEIPFMLQNQDLELQELGTRPVLDNNGDAAQSYRAHDIPVICQKLQIASLKRLSGMEEPLTSIADFATPQMPKTFEQKCVRCHDDGSGAAPSISFGDQKSLETELPLDLLARKIDFRIDADAGEKRMPPQNKPTLTASERAEIRAYLEALGYETGSD